MQLHTSQLLRRPKVALLALPGLLTLYLAFNGGGYFVDEPAVVAVLLAVLLVLRVTLAERPFAGFGRPLVVAGGALGLYAVLCLVSVLWSDSPSRALTEFDRALMYWLALVLFASLPRSPTSTAWALRGVAVAMWAVCAAGLITRALPNVWPISSNLVNERLSYPLTYWNALGLMAAIGLLLAVHFACSEREPAPLRVLGAAAAPVLAATLLFTFSRGAIAAGAVGLVAYLLLARPAGALAGLLAAVPASVVAVIAAYDADLLAREDPTTPAAVAQGHRVALVVGACVLGAALARALLLRLDGRLTRVRLSPRARRSAARGALAAMVVGSVLAFTAFGAAGFAEEQYQRFLDGSSAKGEGPLRARLTDPGNNNRLDHWKIALDGFREGPVLGTGAGTYPEQWALRRKNPLTVVDAHSLYVETLGELGLVGLALIAAAVLAVLAGFARGLRGDWRHLQAALLACGLAWALHAGIDWDWEMPAVSLWFFALGGLVLARPESLPRPAPQRFTRVAVGAGCLALAVTPALMASSQLRLNAAVRALKRGDCTTAIDSSLASIRALGVRPEPFQVLSLCDARLGSDRLAEAAARRMVSLDPRSWEGYYTLALVRANAGLDPRPAARRAFRLNRLEPATRTAVRRFATTDPQKWRRRARAARLPIQ